MNNRRKVYSIKICENDALAVSQNMCDEQQIKGTVNVMTTENDSINVEIQPCSSTNHDDHFEIYRDNK